MKINIVEIRARTMRVVRGAMIASLGTIIMTHATMAQVINSNSASGSDVADNLTGLFGAIGATLAVFAQVAGIVLAIKVGFDFVQYSNVQTRQQVKLSTAGITFLAAVFLFAIPQTLGMGITSLFGDSSTSTASIDADAFTRS